MTPEAAVFLASQHMTERKDITSQEVQLYVRGYHIYTLDMNENLRARNGHLLFSLALVVSAFPRRGVKKRLFEVTSTKANRRLHNGQPHPLY